MLTCRLFALTALCAGLACCEGPANTAATGNGRTIGGVKTTAYTHSEADHKKYKVATAAGGTLKYGDVRSAAADWSVYPVGTQFKIDGDPHVYEVDDYGSALVGTNTIDLYKPTKADMNTWGARNVNIHVTRWGSFSKSLVIMKDREKVSQRVRDMVQRIQRSS